jgi:hypothetical protein
MMNGKFLIVLISLLFSGCTYCKGIQQMEATVNPNLQFLCDSFHNGKSGVVQEGSSRSGKTWADVDFIVFLM